MRVQQLVALATEKFVSDIANAALQYSKIRKAAQKSKKKDRGHVLTTEDLASALRDAGIQTSKPAYFVNPE